MKPKGRALPVLAAALLIVAVASPVASAAPKPTVTPATVLQTISMTSTLDPGAPNAKPLFETGTRTLDDTGGSTLDGISGSVLNGQIGFGFAPPSGQKLHVGTYYDLSYHQQPGRGTVTFYYQELYDDAIGEVQILDLAADATGHLTRYDVLYQINAMNPRGYFFGEARMGEPEPADHVLSNHAVGWPLMPIGEAPVLYTQWLRNTGSDPLPVGRPSLSGANASDFGVYGDNCPTSLPGGGFCTIRIGFSPRAIGDRSGVLSWPVGSGVDHIALSGQAPDGFTEITSTGRNFADNGITNEFVDGKYVQILAGGDNHALGFETTTTNAYESTKWNNTWRASVAAPTGQLLRVGTFHSEAGAGVNQWGFNIDGGEVCEVLTGTLTVRQVLFNADGSLARADINFQGTCDPGDAPTPGRIDAGPMTAQIRYRSTVTHPQYLNQAPAQITVGSTVPITGVTAPGTTVAVWFKGRTQTAFVQRRTLKADAAGRFATSYQAMDDCTYYVKMADYLPVQYLTQIALTMSAPAAVPYGSPVVLSGTGIPGDGVDLVFTPYSTAPVHRSVGIAANGRWTYRYTATQPLGITAQSYENRLTATPITVTVTG